MNTHYRTYLTKPTSVLNMTRVYKNDNVTQAVAHIKFLVHLSFEDKNFWKA